MSYPTSAQRRRVRRARASLAPLAALALAGLLGLLLHGERADARVGGGHTFSGRSSRPSGGSSHSFGSSGRSSPTYLPGSRGSGVGAGLGGCGCFVLILVLVLLVILVLYMRQRGVGQPPPESAPPAPRPPPADLEAIRRIDPEFSVVLFEDFAYALYAKAHEARANARDLEALSPYLSESARAELARRPPAGAPISGVVIGAMRVVDLALPGAGAPAASRAQVSVALEYESNMTAGEPGSQVTQYVSERWVLVRDAGVRTKPPEAVRSFHCPNCGAAFEKDASGDRCQYCGEVVSGGRFDWSVAAIDLLELEDRPPSLTGTAEEEGGSLPTLFHPEVQARRAALLADDPATTDEALAARLRLIYDELNAGWTALDLSHARAFTSDSQFDYLQYWIAAYRHQGLRNVLEGMRLNQLALVKVVRDKHYDSLTFRIWATGHDSTVRVSDGAVVGGNPHADRDYSEYWTIIRGAAVRGAPRSDKNCPNCGAALAVNMAGHCEYCDAHIASGDFDWVLSKIEQDESYSG